MKAVQIKSSWYAWGGVILFILSVMAYHNGPANLRSAFSFLSLALVIWGVVAGCRAITRRLRARHNLSAPLSMSQPLAVRSPQPTIETPASPTSSHSHTSFKMILAYGAAIIVAGLSIFILANRTPVPPVRSQDPLFSGSSFALPGGASGFKTGVADVHTTVEGTDHSAIDQKIINAVADMESFWQAYFKRNFDKTFPPIARYVSYNGKDVGTKNLITKYCPIGYPTDNVVAFFCPDTTGAPAIFWDRHTLQTESDRSGEILPIYIIAHEMGHSVASQLVVGTAAGRLEANTLRHEGQADCNAGAFMRYALAGKAPHLIVTGEGMQGILQNLFSIRQYSGPQPLTDYRGSGFDQINSFLTGLYEGTERCLTHDTYWLQSNNSQEVLRGRGTDDAQQPINDASIQQITSSLEAFARQYYKISPPIVRLTPPTCSGPSAVRYCRADNTVFINIAELTRSTTLNAAEIGRNSTAGDFNAFGLIASQYMLGVQRQLNSLPEDSTAGKRAVCMAGAWLRYSAEDLRISSTDLDEVTAETIRNPQMSEYNGQAVTSSLDRMWSLSTGFLRGPGACKKL